MALAAQRKRAGAQLQIFFFYFFLCLGPRQRLWLGARGSWQCRITANFFYFFFIINFLSFRRLTII